MLILLKPEVYNSNRLFHGKNGFSRLLAVQRQHLRLSLCELPIEQWGGTSRQQKWSRVFHFGQPRQEKHCGLNLLTPEKNEDGLSWLLPESFNFSPKYILIRSILSSESVKK